MHHSFPSLAALCNENSSQCQLWVVAILPVHNQGRGVASVKKLAQQRTSNQKSITTNFVKADKRILSFSTRHLAQHTLPKQLQYCLNACTIKLKFRVEPKFKTLSSH